MINRPDTNAQRLKRHKRVRGKISGTPERPRLNVFRSETNIYAQIIDDVNGKTLVSASSLEKDFSCEGTKTDAAKQVGVTVAERAKAKGIEIAETSNDTAKDYASVVEIKFTSQGKTRSIRGTVIGGQPRLVGVDQFSFDIPMSGDMMYLSYNDEPGVIGIVGNTLGTAGINVAQMTVGRDGGRALMFLTVDQNIPEEIVAKVAKDVGTDDIKFLDLVE